MKTHWIDRGVAFFIAGVCIWLYVLARAFPMGGDLFPRFALAVIIVLCAMMFVQTFPGKSKSSAESAPVIQRRDIARPYLLFGLCLLYVLLMVLIGYLAGSVLTALLLLPALGAKSKPVYLMITAGVILFIYLFFSRFLMVQLPVGLMFV
jgi:hypothetical protein